MLDTLWQSLVLFYVPLFTYRESTIDIWSMGSLWTIAVVLLVNVHLAMDIQRWVFVTHAAIWGSIVVTYGCMVVLDSIPVFPNYGSVYFGIMIFFWKIIIYSTPIRCSSSHPWLTLKFLLFCSTIYHLVKSPVYWLSILLITVIGLLPRFIFKVCHQIFWPSDIQIAREAEILRKRRPFFGSNADQDPIWHACVLVISRHSLGEPLLKLVEMCRPNGIQVLKLMGMPTFCSLVMALYILSVS